MTVLRRRILLVGTAVVRSVRPSVLVGLLILTGCGGGASAPTSPAPTPSSPVIVGVLPSPLTATFVNGDGVTRNFRSAADITLSESTGTGVQISHFTATITKTERTAQGFTFSSSLSQTMSVSLKIAPGGSATQSHVLAFSVAAGETVAWQFSVSGLDSQGRSFTSSTGSIPVELAVPSGAGGG